ncbi:hypothetical protein DFH07DRAFT_907688 [Mycena maculata]|uniref:WD-like domain-containing protein n=1 Tax=Mycena maculata TaxID=230809 RepID=A0AAD7P1X4_9AGAR|nr:hypothetical protein DFH07DRAFT_907688 [Mycena maculata]
MQISHPSFIAVLALAIGLVHATPAVNSIDQLVIASTTAVGEYNLTIWIDAPGASTAAPAAVDARACGSNNVVCDTNNKADASLCSALIGQLDSSTTIANSPRSICLGQSGNECCVSWSKAVGNMPESDLVNAARDVYNGCFSGAISGEAKNVDLNGVCVTQCLSNRPTEC